MTYARLVQVLRDFLQVLSYSCDSALNNLGCTAHGWRQINVTPSRMLFSFFLLLTKITADRSI